MDHLVSEMLMAVINEDKDRASATVTDILTAKLNRQLRGKFDHMRKHKDEKFGYTHVPFEVVEIRNRKTDKTMYRSRNELRQMMSMEKYRKMVDALNLEGEYTNGDYVVTIVD